jgi:RimJ/RimL family protein N-acetyltransferase
MPPRDDRAVSLMVAGMEARTSPRIAAPLGEIATERLRLTHVVAEDADGLAAVFADRAVWEFPYGRGMGREWTGRFVRAAVTHWESFGFGLWVVKTLRDHMVIGYLGLSMPAFLSELVPAERMPAVEIGWRLHPEHWGQGYAAEGAHAALQEATLELSEVCSAPQSLNPRSARVAQRIGMEYERTATLAATDARGAVDVDLYWITRRQWTAQH